MSSENDVKKRAVNDLEAIERLQKNEDFTGYFMRRVLGEVERSREKVLHDRSLKKDDLYEERLRYLAALDTSQLMAKDVAACRSTLGPVPEK